MNYFMRVPISEMGQKQKWLSLNGMSVLPLTTDMQRLRRQVG
jgi:hypothetical protein